MLKKIYQNLIPSNIRTIVYQKFLGNFLYKKRNFKVYFNSFLAYNLGIGKWNDKFDSYKFIGKYGITSYPGEYSLRYDKEKIKVFHDELPYVLHNQKKLYFPKSYNDSQIKRLYNSLIIEQDIQSPHRYLNNYSDIKGFTILDIGSAEGIITLDCIDIIDSAILFECEENWIEALNKTFADYKHKVKIINKYATNQTTNDSLRIDDLNLDINLKLFIKMDIEGNERDAINGAMQTLKNTKVVKIAICTYHKKEDPVYFLNLFRSLNFKSVFTDGHIYWGFRLSKAVLRSEKNGY